MFKSTALVFVVSLIASTVQAKKDSKSFQCDIPDLSIAIADAKARYEKAQQLEKEWIKKEQALMYNLNVNALPSISNPYTAKIAVLGAAVAIVSTTLAVSIIVAPLPAIVMVPATLGTAGAAGGLAPGYIGRKLGNAKINRENSERKYAIDQMLIIYNKDLSSAKAQDLMRFLEKSTVSQQVSTPADLRNSVSLFMNQYDKVHQELDDLEASSAAKDLSKRIGENRAYRVNQIQYATAKKETYSKERSVSDQVRQNLNLICAKLMESEEGEKGAPPARSAPAKAT